MYYTHIDGNYLLVIIYIYLCVYMVLSNSNNGLNDVLNIDA